MKKTLLIMLSGVFLLAGCEKNTELGKEVDTYPLYYSATEYDGDLKTGGTGMSRASISFSELDQVILDITTDPVIASLDVYDSITRIVATVNLTNGEGTLTATPVSLGAAVGSNKVLGLYYEFDGYSANEAVRIYNVSPWSFTAPSITEMDMVDTLWWEVQTANAVVSDVTISIVVNGGAATDYTAQLLDGFMEFDGLSYTRGDKVEITGTATSGTMTAEKKTSFTVKKWSFTNTAEGIVLADGADSYNLDSLRFEAGYNLELLSTVGNVGFTGTDVEFVATDMAFYDDNDVNLTMAAFTAGTKVTTVNSTNIDDAYIFLTDAGTYGLMIITDKEEYTDPTKSSITVDVMILEFED